MKEVLERRFSGPFTKEQIPFMHYIQSPIGLVPKAKNKTRLIFHLSFDFGEEEKEMSVNYHMPKDLCSVKYHDLDSAVKDCIELVKKFNLSQLFFGKTDFSHAFRLLLIKISHRSWLLMKMRHPLTKVLYYFIDKCLPFGSSISCAQFQKFSDAMKHIACWKIRVTMVIEPNITNYLDDFLFIALTLLMCNQMMKIFLQICQEVGCPISEDKTEWATQLIIFLGIN